MKAETNERKEERKREKEKKKVWGCLASVHVNYRQSLGTEKKTITNQATKQSNKQPVIQTHIRANKNNNNNTTTTTATPVRVILLCGRLCVICI